MKIFNNIKRLLAYKKKVRKRYEQRIAEAYYLINRRISEFPICLTEYNGYDSHDDFIQDIWNRMVAIREMFELNREEINDLKAQLALAEEQLKSNGQYHVHINKKG